MVRLFRILDMEYKYLINCSPRPFYNFGIYWCVNSEAYIAMFIHYAMKIIKTITLFVLCAIHLIPTPIHI